MCIAFNKSLLVLFKKLKLTYISDDLRVSKLTVCFPILRCTIPLRELFVPRIGCSLYRNMLW